MRVAKTLESSADISSSEKENFDSEKHSCQQGQIHTVQTFAANEPAFNEGSIRWTIFQHKDKLLEAGAIFYHGRKLLIDRGVFIACVKEGL